MTKYILPNIIPKNAQIIDDEITFGQNIILTENDTIEIKKNVTLKILYNVKLTVKKIINHGVFENAGDTATKSLYNYGKINNVDLLIINKGDLYNEGLIENYFYLYLFRAKHIINKKLINNYCYTGAFIFLEEDKFYGNKINLIQ